MTETTSKHPEPSAFERIGGQVSSWVSDVAANPLAQLGVILVCAAWFALGLNTNVLTAILSIMAISLTQMVLNRQIDREADAHLRDVAMHAKLDELLLASRRARDEMAGIENLEEEEIEQLKQEAKEAIEAVEDDVATPDQRKVAEEAMEEASDALKAKAKREPRGEPKSATKEDAAATRK